MRKFKLSKKTVTTGSVALLAGAILAVSGCQAAEVLNFYKVMSASSSFTNYSYYVAMESDQLADAAKKQEALENAFDGVALKGIVTDGDAFSAGIQLKINGNYEDVTQVVIRDNRIYLDLGSILKVVNKLAPSTYSSQIQPNLDKIKEQMDENPEEFNKQLSPYGVTVDDIKSRLDDLGWVYISFSTVDEGISAAKDANESIKNAVSIDKIETLDDDKYPEAAKIIAQKIADAFENRFGKIEPSFTGINKDKNAYTFHLCNDNMESFLDGCAAFASEDLIPIIDSSVEALKKENITNGADALEELKKKLNEGQERYDYSTGETVKESYIDSIVNGINKSKESFVKNKNSMDFDWLSTVSLTGEDGERTWKLVNTIDMKKTGEVGETKNTSDSDKPLVADMMSVIDYPSDTIIEDSGLDALNATVTITFHEFKDMSAALAAMPDPGNDAFCLDTAALSALDSMKNINSGYSGYSNYDDYSDYDYYSDYSSEDSSNNNDGNVGYYDSYFDSDNYGATTTSLNDYSSGYDDYSSDYYDYSGNAYMAAYSLETALNNLVEAKAIEFTNDSVSELLAEYYDGYWHIGGLAAPIKTNGDIGFGYGGKAKYDSYDEKSLESMLSYMLCVVTDYDRDATHAICAQFDKNGICSLAYCDNTSLWADVKDNMPRVKNDGTFDMTNWTNTSKYNIDVYSRQ